MGSFLSGVFRAAYGILLAYNMMLAAVCTNLVYVLPISKFTKEGCSIILVQAAWQIAFLFSPWVWCVAESGYSEQWGHLLDSMDKADAESARTNTPKRPLFILSNHSSFLDTVLATAKIPSRVIYRCRTYMDHHLFKLPVLSTICRAAGHFPVHFKSTEEGSFKVDNDKMELVDKAVDEHLSSGGWLCFFPEGQMNKTPDVILPLRYGGIKKALAFDARLTCFISHGNPKVWPKKAPVGGFPGTIRYNVLSVAPDGVKAYVTQIRQEDIPEERELSDHELLAQRIQKLMQQEYDALKAGPSKVD